MDNEDDVSYLDIKPEDRVAMPPQDKVWAQIGDDLKLAYINWEMIELMAGEFDTAHKKGKEKTQTQVMSKLLVLVRDEMKQEVTSAPSVFAFFHVGEDITQPQRMVRSLIEHNPNAFIIMHTDPDTPDVEGVSARWEHDVDRDNLMYSRVKCYAEDWQGPLPVLYLDTDMVIQSKLNVAQMLDGKDAALCRRAFSREALFNIEQRGLKFPEYQGKTLDELYPYVGCAVVAKNNKVWQDLLAIYDGLDSKFKKWYGDQEALRIYAERNDVAELSEAVYACLPEHAHISAKILHYKGNRK